jgi:hypothetical protein
MKRAALLVALCVLAAAPPAVAKEDVHAHLVSKLPRDARAGQTIRVVWRLYSIEDGRRRPFGASELFVKLRGAPKVYGEGRNGRYTARVKVPRRGIKGIRFGLDGIRIIGDRTEAAPMYFPLDNDPFK